MLSQSEITRRQKRLFNLLLLLVMICVTATGMIHRFIDYTPTVSLVSFELQRQVFLTTVNQAKVQWMMAGMPNQLSMVFEDEQGRVTGRQKFEMSSSGAILPPRQRRDNACQALWNQVMALNTRGDWMQIKASVLQENSKRANSCRYCSENKECFVYNYSADL